MLLEPQPQAAGSSRARLARVARDAAMAVPGVVGADAGPRGWCVTEDQTGTLLRGVSVIAQPDGRYAVDLCLVAEIVSLLTLAEEVRARLQARAARESLISQLGSVSVHFARVLSAWELSELVAREHEEATAAEATAAAEASGAPRASFAPLSSAPVDDGHLL